jgi:type I restriction enzyme S subunit
MSTKAQRVKEEEVTAGDSELPEGWSEARIPDLIGANGVFLDGDWVESKDQDPSGNVRLVQLADVGDGVFRNRSNRFLTSQKASELGCTFLEAGDILIARMPDPLGRACIFPGDKKRSVTVVDVCIIRPESPIENSWLMHSINSPGFRSDIEAEQKGTTRLRISRSSLAALQVPVPPSGEQRRIAEKIDSAFAEIHRTQLRLRRITSLLLHFRQSVLAAACSGKLTEDWRGGHNHLEPALKLLERLDSDRRAEWEKSNKIKGTRSPKYPQPTSLDSHDLPGVPDSWTWATLDQIGQQGRPIIYGIIKPGPHVPDGVPYVRVTEMKDGHIDIKQLRRTSHERAAKFARATLEPGDVLISKDGTIGRVAVVPPELKGGNITQHVMRAPTHRFIERDYIVAAIRAPYVQLWLTGELKGVALQGVNVEDFRRLPLPIPPPQEQKEIVRRVEALFKLADAIEKRVAAASLRAERLTQAILAKAFRGELVPTEAELARREGRSYEPASALLERIKAEREAAQQKQLRRGKKTRAVPTKT